MTLICFAFDSSLDLTINSLISHTECRKRNVKLSKNV